MAYSEVTNGTDLFLFIGANPLAHAKSWTLSVKLGSRNVSDKETGDYEQVRPTRFTPTVNADGLLAYGDFESLITGFTAKTPMTLYLGKANRNAAGAATGFATGSTYASGVFYATSWEQTGGDGDNATYSVGFEHCSGFAYVNK